MCSYTVNIVLNLSPPPLQTGLHEVQLLLSDAVRSWVWWALDGWSALGERLVYGGSLAAGNQSLWWICVSGGKRLKLYAMFEERFSIISVE